MTWLDVAIPVLALLVAGAIIGIAVIVWQACSMSRPSSDHKRAIEGLKRQWELEQ